MPDAPTRVPAVEGWFTLDDPPALLGSHCASCGTYAFPPKAGACPNPRCDATSLETVPLSRTGTVWSYTENRYAPPPPFMATDPFEPFALAAVELATERLVVLGQVVKGVGAADLAVGQSVELVLETLFVEGGTEHVVWKWRPA